MVGQMRKIRRKDDRYQKCISYLTKSQGREFEWAGFIIEKMLNFLVIGCIGKTTEKVQ